MSTVAVKVPRASQSFQMAKRPDWYAVTLAAVVIVYGLLTAGSSLTKRPWSDEGWFACAGYNLAAHGFTGTTVIEEQGTNLTGINRRTYWVLPLHIAAQGLWYQLTGFSLFSLRMLSAVFGIVGLLSWYVIAGRLTGNLRVALLASALIAVDYFFVQLGSFGRYDMMSAALGAAALASYLKLRENHLTAAVLVSHVLVVANGLTHFMGIFAWLALVLLMFHFDRARLQWRHLAYAVTPYLIGGSAWGWYVMQDFDSFRAQFMANATTGNRLAGMLNPWIAIKREVLERYFVGFGLGSHSPGHSGPIILKSLALAAYWLGALGCLAAASLRRHSAIRLLLIFTALCFVLLTLLDGHKQTWYLVYITPLYACLLAAWVMHLFENRLLPRWLIAAGIAGLIAVETGGTLYRMKLNTYQSRFLPAMRYLRASTDPQSTIMGSAEAGFGIGFDRKLIDDVQLGAVSGKVPDVIVVEENYEGIFKAFETERPGVYEFINKRLSQEFQPVYKQSDYTIYTRRRAAP
jgi:hypothetical protein